MRLAVNYSPELARLITDRTVKVDLVKCPDWPDLIAAARPLGDCYVHFTLVLGNGTMQNIDLNMVEDFLAATATPHVNCHISPMSSAFGGLDAVSLDGRTRRTVVDAVLRDGEKLANRFGPEKIAAENLFWYHKSDGQIMRCCLLPEVICEIIEKVGCNFLLDLSHARIAAQQMGFDAKEYVSALPTAFLQEMHITGIGKVDGEMEDHLPLAGPDWEMAHWAFDHIHAGRWNEPAIVSFEYGGIGPHFEWRSQSEVLLEQVPRLFALVHQKEKANHKDHKDHKEHEGEMA